MLKNVTKHLVGVILILTLNACHENTEPTDGPKLIVKIEVSSDQVRLGNNGSPSSVANGNAAQSPVFNFIAAHYLELAPDVFTKLGDGAVLYHAPETTSGGANAIDFSKSILAKSGDVYLEIPLSQIPTGSYKWARMSVSYQNYDVQFYYAGQPYTGTLASFVGYNTFIKSFNIKNQQVELNANKLQGYWAFESIGGVKTGQSPAGATTVPNPLFATSPIPSGSCVVTGEFANDFIITGKETADVIVTMSLSINNSFEWKDINSNGKWDVDPNSGEDVVDMGLRGLVPIIE